MLNMVRSCQRAMVSKCKGMQGDVVASGLDSTWLPQQVGAWYFDIHTL